MQSAAPLFNKAIFHKNLHRFWPIFTAYTVVLLLISFSIISNERYEMMTEVPALFVNTIFGFSSFMPVLIAIFSIIAAAAVFSYMYNPMSTAMVNALPFTRRTVFISNYLSGLFMVMVPLLVFFLSLVGIGLSYASLDMAALLKWLFIFVSLSLLLYSLAVIVGMLTGNIIAHIVFFGIANFLLIGLEGLVLLFLDRFLYGFTVLSNSNPFFIKATPIVYASSINNTYTHIQWWVWIAYLLVGVLLIWLAQKMYAKRKMENAGDIITIRQLYPIFKYGVTFCSSLAIGIILLELFSIRSSFALAMIFFLLTGMVGYFVAEMLLRKSFRVLGSYKGFLVYAVLLIIVSMSVYCDWYGYATRFPDTDRVEAVHFSYSGAQYDKMQILQADKGRVGLERISNLPPSLAIAYGTPVSMERDPQSNDYIYPDATNLTPEETRLLWSVVPGIYYTDESIDSILKVHQYLTDNIQIIRKNYRQLDNSQNYRRNESLQNFEISFSYRLDNGKIQQHSFPVRIPMKASTEIDQEILTQLAFLAGCQEDRNKKLAAIDLPAENIRRITIDMNMLRHMKSNTLNQDAITKITADLKEDDFVPLEIRAEDRAGFLEAAKTGYQNMPGKKIIRSLRNVGTMEIMLDNPTLPYENKFQERAIYFDFDVYNQNIFNFLKDRGYINEDVFKFIIEYRNLLDAKYNTPMD